MPHLVRLKPNSQHSPLAGSMLSEVPGIHVRTGSKLILSRRRSFAALVEWYPVFFHICSWFPAELI